MKLIFKFNLIWCENVALLVIYANLIYSEIWVKVR